jgi:glycerophosphoryl diester phosphodiesterase
MAGVRPDQVFAQSFNLSDVLYWLEANPDFGAHAVYLEDRNETDENFRHTDPATWKPGMTELVEQGVKTLAPPIWMLVALDDENEIVPSIYAKAARAAGLDIVPWSLERSGPLASGGGWYYQTIGPATDGDGMMYELLDVLAKQVGIRRIFTDWPSTTTFYANCMGLN